MTKKQAIELFGTPKALAKALGCGVHAIYMWDDNRQLPLKSADQVTGAAYRLGLLPKKSA